MTEKRIPIEFLDFTNQVLLNQYRMQNLIDHHIPYNDPVYLLLQERCFVRKHFEINVSNMLMTCEGLYVKSYREQPCVLRSTQSG